MRRPSAPCNCREKPCVIARSTENCPPMKGASRLPDMPPPTPTRVIPGEGGSGDDRSRAGGGARTHIEQPVRRNNAIGNHRSRDLMHPPPMGSLSGGGGLHVSLADPRAGFP